MAKDFSKVPLQPVYQWYRAFVREMKKLYGDKWLDHVPEDHLGGILKIHQEATLDYMRQRDPERMRRVGEKVRKENE